MSIASDHAARVKAATPPEGFYAKDGDLCARADITKDGYCYLCGTVTSYDVLRLARWINATFGETP